MEARRSRVSGLHSRTFEMELLISGAVVFGLFLLPPRVVPFFENLLVRLEGFLRIVAVYGQSYFLLMIYGLIGAFLLHLATRAFWIGLVGLESVFPDGIRWDRLKAGPYTIDLGRRKMESLARFIDRVDDLCSLIFSFGFLIVVVFIYSVILLAVSGFLGFALSRIVGGLWSSEQIFWVIFGFVLGLQIVAGIVDRVLGPRIARDSVPGKIMTAVFGLFWIVSPLRWIGPIQFTLQSNTSNTRFTALTTAAMMLLAVATLGVMYYQEGVLRYDSLVYFPESLREEGVDPRHYRSLRKEGALQPRYPSIQSDVITEPYLKLTIPYYPQRHNPAIAKACPDVSTFRSPGFAFGRGAPPENHASRAVAACLASLFDIELDGEILGDLSFDFTIEPGSGLEAIVAYISLKGLPQGRHEILVIEPPLDEAPADDSEGPTRRRHIIPFWC